MYNIIARKYKNHNQIPPDTYKTDNNTCSLGYRATGTRV